MIDLKNSIIQHCLLYIMSFFITMIVTVLMIRVHIHDIPNERSSHKKITPRGAGLGILLSFVFVWIFKGFNGIPFYELYFYWTLCLSANAIMGMMGLLDDLFNINEFSKLIFQIFIVLSLALFGVRFMTLPLPLLGDIVLNMALSIIITLLWIVGFMNAYNFMDGSNGMTCIVTIIASFFWFLITYQSSAEILSFSALILIFANLGFLGFNFSKNMILLGNIGSLFMGSLFALWAILGTLPQFGSISMWTVPMLFCLYLYDVIFTRIHRLYRGHSFMSAHREHVYQLLNQIGWSHPQVMVLYGSFFCFQGITAYYMQTFPSYNHFYFFLPYLSVYSLLTCKVLIKARRSGVNV